MVEILLLLPVDLVRLLLLRRGVLGGCRPRVVSGGAQATWHPGG